MQSQLRGTCLVALSGLLFGLMGFLGTQLFYLHFSVENMLFWRFLIATLWVSLSITILRKDTVKKINPPMALLKVFALGAITYSGASAFYFIASKHIGTGLAMVIFFSFPVFVILFSWLSGNWKMNKVAFLALIAVMIGLIFLKGQGVNEIDTSGILFAIAGALFFAIYIYSSQHSTKNIDSQFLTFFVCLGNAFIFLILSCSTKSFVVPHTFNSWFYICAIGIIATALPIQLLLQGLNYISPVKASILSVLEPVGTVIVGCLLLNETLSYMQWLGILFVLSGALFVH